MLKQNFPSQTCREWFIKLCACGPDFAARNECSAIVSNVYVTIEFSEDDFDEDNTLPSSFRRKLAN